MKFMSLSAPGSYSIVESDLDPTMDAIALMRVISSGFCAADDYLWSGNHPWSLAYPIVPGHELFGEIIEIDDYMQTDFPIGSKVAIQVIVPCGNCSFCVRGIKNMCQEKRHFGSTFKGAFSDVIQVPRGALMHKSPAQIDDSVGGLAETMANAIYAVNRVGVPADSRVLILGMGSIGASIAVFLKFTRADVNVSVLTSSNSKKFILRDLGIEALALDELDSHLDEFDVVMETSGHEPNFQFGLKAVKPRGTFFQYGVFKNPISVDFNLIGEFKELTVIGGHLADDRSFEQSLVFLCEHQNNLKFLISKVVGFSDFESAFDSNGEKMFKTIFQPHFEKGSA